MVQRFVIPLAILCSVFVSLLWFLVSPLVLRAAPAADPARPAASTNSAGNSSNDAQNDSEDAVESARPLVKWAFDTKPVGTWRGSANIADKGPQPPLYPGFPTGNKAAQFGPGNGGPLVVAESDLPDANLRFTNGDGLTLEAWVNLEQIADGEFRYLIGKGRNRNAAFAPENQNYALRLKGEAGEARLSFLFRTASEKLDTQRDYHRWTSTDGFPSDGGWHHVAVTYTFGMPDSLRGYIDGREVLGTWDLGGKTTLPPISDADDLVLGTGNGGGAGNSFDGWLDEVAVYRAVLPEAVLIQRYQFVPPPPVIDVAQISAGQVLVQICEDGVPAKNAWPSLPPRVGETYFDECFGLNEVPHKYVDSGVRGDRTIPYLLRVAGKTTLPPGRHRLLLRGRGATRLQVNGKQILTIPFPKGDAGGHGHVAEQDGYLDLGPDFRFAPPGTQETWCHFDADGSELLVVVESLIGGVLGKSRRRPETGELVVAWSREGTESWELLSPGTTRVPYTDAGWAAYEARFQERLALRNAERRRELRTQHAPYWDQRRKAVADWLAQTPEEPVPPLPAGFPAQNPIDHFLAAKIAKVASQAAAAKQGRIDFYRDIQPILEAKCYDCHRGGKAQAGLRLDSKADALRGGESEGPAIVPGQPAQSPLLTRIRETDPSLRMPAKGTPLSNEQVALIEAWIGEGAIWPEVHAPSLTLTPLTDDLTFLRRVTLDTVGVVPSLAEIESFLGASPATRRSTAIDRLLADSRWADHGMGYWQDVLAENPNILNPTLNNTGPFRWWIYESLLDNKPFDLFVTELLRMRGSERLGGPAGFSVASQNDAPMAAKGTIVSAAFLGIEMKCARCHDAPAHVSTQRDLFELAAMLNAKPLTVPATSSVSAEKLTAGGRKPLITVTLATGSEVTPRWPFEKFCAESDAAKFAQDPNDSRDRLAALITAPTNERFPQVIANRIWKRFMGRGIVEPVDDWEKGRPSHPELLRWLGREFVRGGYDLKHLARFILNSHAYQRATDPALKETNPLFAAPAPRRLAAEQIVDSLFAATGKPFQLEEVSLDIDGRRDMGNSISLGQPRRCWMLTSTSNERDRPSLSLPRIQAVADVLSAFGWRGARQDPSSVRETAPNALQPAILSNGTVSTWLTRLSDDHGMTAMALEHQTVEQFVEQLFLRLLTRPPTATERERYLGYLRPGYDARIVSWEVPPAAPSVRKPPRYVSWSNHLDPEATLVRQEQELAARRGEPPSLRLQQDWRERCEDVLWAILNSPEFVFSP